MDNRLVGFRPAPCRSWPCIQRSWFREMQCSAKSSSLVDDVTVFAFEFRHGILRPSEMRSRNGVAYNSSARLWFGVRWHCWQFSTAFFIDTTIACLTTNPRVDAWEIFSILCTEPKMRKGPRPYERVFWNQGQGIRDYGLLLTILRTAGHVIFHHRVLSPGYKPPSVHGENRQSFYFVSS